ncbi:hypothetical protein [Leuconostoc falkenbergense]|uniref:hypothetical protein n=1 Tax=Leuconostoc falkenbergense TaxID=2766470 RepID=UPI0021AABB33|nr:hypothetical protein [Leuconostoc falkenbergense]MCT4390581.1 hypothetical protein [Leuconostoc falkenbergense]
MSEPVAYLVNGVAFNDINRAKFYSDVLKYHKKIKIDVESIVPIPLYTAEQLHPRVKMTQAEFDELEMWLINAQFDYSELKKTIEIVPNMKWFVRSKEKEHGNYWILAESRFSDMPRYTVYKSYAMTFDTKEEAEQWTNPLTEAVQLPVEGE